MNPYITENPELYDRVMEYLMNYTTASQDVIRLKSSLKNDLGVDSLALTEMVILLEDTFEILLDASDLDPERLKTVEDIVILVFKYVNVGN